MPKKENKVSPHIGETAKALMACNATMNLFAIESKEKKNILERFFNTYAKEAEFAQDFPKKLLERRAQFVLNFVTYLL